MYCSVSDSGLVIPVSELTRRVRVSLEREFPLLWVAGEVSNLTRAASGHLYFSLKDETAQVRCVMFRSRAQGIPWRLENGQQVEVRALPSLYEARGEFQLTVEGMRRAGLGRLFEAFARLKQRLDAEGLFAAERKRPLPRYPGAIGIVTSPHAAALDDVIAATRRRAPHMPLILYPSLVQGDSAGEAIAAAIVTAGKRAECDLLLVVRGGGSMEDLWAFNEEVVARALAACPIATICGVGHESDITIADLVADHRAATPTAAAEQATQGWFEARGHVAKLSIALARSADYYLHSAQQRLDNLSLHLVHPSTRLQRTRGMLDLLASRLGSLTVAGYGARRARVDGLALRLMRETPQTERPLGHLRLLSQRMDTALREQNAHRRHTLASIGDALHHLNPESILGRGFAIVRDASGKVLSDTRRIVAGDAISLELAGGEVDATVNTVRPAQSGLHRI